MKQIKVYIEGSPEFDTQQDVFLTKEVFRECIQDTSEMIWRAFSGSFVIPMFSTFCSIIDNIYWECRTHSDGKVCQ